MGGTAKDEGTGDEENVVLDVVGSSDASPRRRVCRAHVVPVAAMSSGTLSTRAHADMAQRSFAASRTLHEDDRGTGALSATITLRLLSVIWTPDLPRGRAWGCGSTKKFRLRRRVDIVGQGRPSGAAEGRTHSDGATRRRRLTACFGFGWRVSATGRRAAPLFSLALGGGGPGDDAGSRGVARRGARGMRARPEAAHRRHSPRLGWWDFADGVGGRDRAAGGRAYGRRVAPPSSRIRVGGYLLWGEIPVPRDEGDCAAGGRASGRRVAPPSNWRFRIAGRCRRGVAGDEYIDCRPASEAMSICIDVPRATCSAPHVVQVRFETCSTSPTLPSQAERYALETLSTTSRRTPYNLSSCLLLSGGLYRRLSAGT
ncbi:hypothetical protein BD626DRAFT_566218 [Schizophyllum amplum]|uniref:Uncharacterized protein n=1 Tax=Schizophyllum amplum TaxID=97359 RepID=A0A550CQW2_9AGAR|nr:hypothetical protein BD626DRAFT_566218 [Auriculariopsis ampla]